MSALAAFATSPAGVFCARGAHLQCPSVQKSAGARRVCAPVIRRAVACETGPSHGPLQRFAGWYKRGAEGRKGALGRYGLAAVLSYGLFDALTYGCSFVVALRLFIISGKVLTRKTLPQVLTIMWGLNNLSRPFRVAGALALAPLMDRRVVKPVGAFFGRMRRGKRDDPQGEDTNTASELK